MNSTQLELELHDVRLQLPWDGRSPRELTRVGLSSIFKAGAVKKRERIRDPRQEEMWPTGRGLPQYEGAPLLLPF